MFTGDIKQQYNNNNLSYSRIITSRPVYANDLTKSVSRMLRFTTVWFRFVFVNGREAKESKRSILIGVKYHVPVCVEN